MQLSKLAYMRGLPVRCAPSGVSCVPISSITAQQPGWPTAAAPRRPPASIRLRAFEVAMVLSTQEIHLELHQ